MLLEAALAAAMALGAGRASLDILSPPAASPSPAPVGTEVAFDALASGDSVEYSWDFGDGSPVRAYSADPKAVHSYSRPGRFTVVARIRDRSGLKPFAFFVIAHPPLAERRPSSAASMMVDAARGRVWVVNPDHGTVSCLDARALVRLFEVPVGAGPRTLAQAPDGAVWVANQEDATLSVLNPSDGSPVALVKLPFASRPHGIAFSPDGRAAFVTLEAVGKVIRLDPSTRSVTGEAAVGGRPRGLAVPDRGPLIAAGFLARGSIAEVTAVDPAGMAVAGRIVIDEDATEDGENQGSGGFNHLAALAVSPDGSRAWLPAKKDNIRRGTTRDGRALTFENTVRAAMLRLTLPAGGGGSGGPGATGGVGAEEKSLRLDIDDSEGPSAVAFGPWGFPAFMAFQGSDKVVAWDPWGEQRVMALDRVGANPRGLAVDSAAGRLFVQAFLDRSVSVYDVGDLVAGRETGAVFLKSIPTATGEPLAPDVLAGKRIFNKAAEPRMSRDGYLTCATCHGDGGEDGRVWDFTDRGEGLRNTQSLMGRAGAGYGPLHWSANFDEVQDFEHDMRGPFGGSGFMSDEAFHGDGRDSPLGARKAGASPELDALAAYVASLKRVPPSPYRAPDGAMTPEALEGKALFLREDVGCARCHDPASYYTDSRLPSTALPPMKTGDTVVSGGFLVHDVGTRTPASGGRLGATLAGFDTPGLEGAWFTAPYLHDGSAATLEEVVERAVDGKHGNTGILSPEDRRKLAVFLRQIDALDEKGNGGTGIRGPARIARGWDISAVPLGTGGWRLEASGSAAAPLAISILDPLGRTLGVTWLGPAGTDGRRSWIWKGPAGGGHGLPAGAYLLRACSGKDCMGRLLATRP